jgi:hypothetical protein
MTQNINGEATLKTLGKIKKFSVEINNDNNPTREICNPAAALHLHIFLT